MAGDGDFDAEVNRIEFQFSSADPVGQQLLGVETLLERYRLAGILDFTHDFYPGGRHEMLNETNGSEVLASLLNWITGRIERPWPG
jgi:alpha-beta hydrolase superfamily lysophospholipase